MWGSNLDDKRVVDICFSTVSSGVPSVTGREGSTFDTQSVTFYNADEKTVKSIRCTRTGKTRPYWTIKTEEPHWQDEVVIAERVKDKNVRTVVMEYANTLNESAGYDA